MEGSISRVSIGGGRALRASDARVRLTNRRDHGARLVTGGLLSPGVGIPVVGTVVSESKPQCVHAVPACQIHHGAPLMTEILLVNHLPRYRISSPQQLRLWQSTPVENTPEQFSYQTICDQFRARPRGHVTEPTRTGRKTTKRTASPLTIRLSRSVWRQLANPCLLLQQRQRVLRCNHRRPLVLTSQRQLQQEVDHSPDRVQQAREREVEESQHEVL